MGPSLESQIKKLVKRIASLPKKYKVGVGIGIAAIVVILIAVANLNSTINLNNYVTVTFEGYDGYGKATATIDWNKILDKYKKRFLTHPKQNPNMNMLYSDIQWKNYSGIVFRCL